MVALFAYLTYLSHARPYDKRHLDIMDAFASLASSCILFCGLLFYTWVFNPKPH